MNTGGIYLDKHIDGEFYETEFDNDIENTEVRKLKMVDVFFPRTFSSRITKRHNNKWFLEGSKYYNSVEEMEGKYFKYNR